MKKILILVTFLFYSYAVVSANWVSDTVIDQALNKIAESNRVDIVSDSGQPTGLSNSLAATTLTSGSFTVTDGDVSGRKIIIAEKANIDVSAPGMGRKVVLSKDGTLLFVGDITPINLPAGSKITIPEFEYEIPDL